MPKLNQNCKYNEVDYFQSFVMTWSGLKEWYNNFLIMREFFDHCATITVIEVVFYRWCMYRLHWERFYDRCATMTTLGVVFYRYFMYRLSLQKSGNLFKLENWKLLNVQPYKVESWIFRLVRYKIKFLILLKRIH